MKGMCCIRWFLSPNIPHLWIGHFFGGGEEISCSINRHGFSFRLSIASLKDSQSPVVLYQVSVWCVQPSEGLHMILSRNPVGLLNTASSSRKLTTLTDGSRKRHLHCSYLKTFHLIRKRSQPQLKWPDFVGRLTWCLSINKPKSVNTFFHTLTRLGTVIQSFPHSYMASDMSAESISDVPDPIWCQALLWLT